MSPDQIGHLGYSPTSIKFPGFLLQSRLYMVGNVAGIWPKVYFVKTVILQKKKSFYIGSETFDLLSPPVCSSVTRK